eukprot:TRINITY_DN10472_c0_g3_i3.p1 TRINITY_DN10472_c0_g3~~TRINITY_DN10472_c0_g3_i3.p1  ORF type:complete len:403 (+),score=133.65 TRINITY_DN10472_c0_g3_i3:55-1263(+)
MAVDAAPAAAGRLLYLLGGARAASVAPFLGSFLRQCGYSQAEVGWLKAAVPLGMLLGAPLWGMAADVTADPRRCMLVGAPLSCALMVMLCTAAQGGTAVGTLAAAAAVCAVAGACFTLDTLVVLGSGSAGPDYGRRRLWLSLGWGTASFGVAYIVYRLQYGGMLLAHVLLTAMYVAVVYFGVPCRSPRPADGRPLPTGATLAGLRDTCGRLAGGFALRLLCFGVLFTSVNSFTPHLLIEELGASPLAVGLQQAVNVASEVPVLWASQRILRQRGLTGLMDVATLTLVARAAALSVSTHQWQAISLGALHGLSVSLYQVAAVEYARQRAGRTTHGVALGAMQALTSCVAPACGEFVFSQLWAARGLRSTMAIAAAAALLSAAAFRAAGADGGPVRPPSIARPR